jgi:hypothetical protein
MGFGLKAGNLSLGTCHLALFVGKHRLCCCLCCLNLLLRALALFLEAKLSILHLTLSIFDTLFLLLNNSLLVLLEALKRNLAILDTLLGNLNYVALLVAGIYYRLLLHKHSLVVANLRIEKLACSLLGKRVRERKNGYYNSKKSLHRKIGFSIYIHKCMKSRAIIQEMELKKYAASENACCILSVMMTPLSLKLVNKCRHSWHLVSVELNALTGDDVDTLAKVMRNLAVTLPWNLVLTARVIDIYKHHIGIVVAEEGVGVVTVDKVKGLA